MKKITKLREGLNKAKREGWFKWIRQGDGQEADERAILNGCTFDVRRAEHFTEYCETYATLTEGAFNGKPFRLTDWQHEFAYRLFGWVRFEPDWQKVVRRFRIAYLEVPKKNGKTPFVATINNYLLLADAEPGSQVNTHIAATTKDKAKALMKHCVRQVKNNDELREQVFDKTVQGYPELHFGSSCSSCLAAVTASTDGINGHVLSDEVHLWKDPTFYRTLLWSIPSLPEGLFLGISTAGMDFESTCRELHQKSREVAAGSQIDESFFGVIYGLNKEDDPDDEENWFKANPSLGTVPEAPLKLSAFKADYTMAKNGTPSDWRDFLQRRLGVWQTAENPWLPTAPWDLGKSRRSRTKKRIDCYENFRFEDLIGRECTMAFDGATTRDTSAAVFSFPDEDEDELYRIMPFYWLPMNRAIELRKKVNYEAWANDGLITLTDGDAVDFTRVFEDLLKLFEYFDVQDFYFDPLFQCEWLTQRLEEETEIERTSFPQTIVHFTQPTKLAERLITEKKLLHNGHKLFTWQLGNTQAKSDVNQNIRPVKQKHGDSRTIDGPVAMIMSLKDYVGDYDSGDDDQEYSVQSF